MSRHTYQTTQKGSVTIDGESEDFSLQMANTVRQKVHKVDDQGVATIDARFEDPTLTISGEEIPIPEVEQSRITYEMSGDGSIQNVRGTHGLAGPLGERQFDPGQIFQLQGPIFREGSIRKGDKWQQTVTIPMPGLDNVQATIDYTYMGRESVNGKDAAKIGFSFDTGIDATNTESGEVLRLVGREQLQGIVFFGLKVGKTIKASGSGPLELSLRTPSEGGGEDLERIKVDINIDFNWEAQD
ncbi:MAG: hypothetical protein HYX94_04760 [Chloroflexi bacterium]|nr:hypothetical protein [Chloroflexota bacterium]